MTVHALRCCRDHRHHHPRSRVVSHDATRESCTDELIPAAPAVGLPLSLSSSSPIMRPRIYDRTEDPDRQSIDSDSDDEPGADHNNPYTSKRLRAFASKSTFHGVDLICTPSAGHVDRVFWTLIVVLMFVGVVFQLRSLFGYFYQNPTLSRIGVYYPEAGLDFPAVTICSLTKINASAVEELYPQVNKTLAEFSLSSFFSAYATSLMDMRYFSRRNHSHDHLQRSLDEVLAAKNRSLFEFYEDTSFTCANHFLTCWFENAWLFDCCANNSPISIKRHLMHNGPCYEFQPKPGVRQRLPGPVGGFGFVYWYPNTHILKSAFNNYDEHAVHLFTSPAEAMLEKNPIALPVGYHAHISISTTKTQRQMHDPLGRTVCHQHTLKYFNNYSYAQCQVECLIDAMFEQCGCTGVSTYGNFSHAKICTPKGALKCFNSLALNFTTILVYCRQHNCEEACEYWSYKASLTVGKTFNKVIEEEMIDYWHLRHLPGLPVNSLIIGDVYFDEIQYVEVKELPAITFEMLISSIGGTMGLWTGASIITWIHLIYFCTCMLLKRRRRRQETARARVAGAAGDRQSAGFNEISPRSLDHAHLDEKTHSTEKQKNNNCFDAGRQTESIHTESTV
uniref:Amiloride-sensitive sodium channel n=1 Tax=Plectus sambesii TaxID=2011161 RepID=A0A914V0C5_9BILA